MENNKITILKELRLNTKYNQTELAKLLGIPRINYNKYELGVVKPDINTLVKIADFYNVSLDFLCGRQYNNNIGHIPDDKKSVVKKLVELDLVSIKKVEGYIQALIDENKKKK